MGLIGLRLCRPRNWYRQNQLWQLCITSFLSVRELLEVVMSVLVNLKFSRIAVTLWTQRSLPVLTLNTRQVER